ncbi:MAG: bifunctional folylpolyglutamate synthase/dihydrofolate synthase [Chlorobi bacterium]|nr:bifunctional folylpolyglutamate synthase/dihydrofolate synthase [Chlorobiota bacterium]
MYQRVGPAAYKADLKITLALDQHFGHPHRAFRSVHIAGTNGKGSVAHMLAAISQEAGLKTGLYTSPHLKDFTERIKINGNPIPDDYITAFFNAHFPVFERIRPSFFEMTVMLSFCYFRDQKVDVAMIETGLGGRLDSTNIITPVLSVITNIGKDHTRFLGGTLPEIAYEKAGIIKKEIPVVVGEILPETLGVFEKQAKEKKAPLYLASQNYQVLYGLYTPEGFPVMNVYNGEALVYEKIKLDLPGTYQRKNLITALQSVDVLQDIGFIYSTGQLYSGLSKVKQLTGFKGRWEILEQHPLTVADTAHNEMGLVEVLSQVKQTPRKDMFFILGFVEDKDLDTIVRLFPAEAHYIFTRPNVPRGLDAEKLAAIFGKRGISGRVIPDPVKALVQARMEAGPDDMIYIGGSTFVVAAIL